MANAQLPKPESRRSTLDYEPRGTQTQAATLVAPPLPQRPALAPQAAHQVVTSSSVSGPSFLGLNDAPAEAEYLLEDEHRSGRGLRMLLLLIVLVAIAGLVYMQYRSSLNGSPRSPAMPKPDPAGLPRPSGDNRVPNGVKSVPVAAGANTVQSGVTAVGRASPTETDAKTKTSNKKAAREEVAMNRKSADPAPDDDPPAPAANKPSQALVRAQQYLHGQGVRQNCEQGLVYLRAATRENDPGAAVQMGTLYASGFCVQQDRVKAYKWFTTAREMQPENRWIAKNLDQLWAQMTPQERRQIR